MVFDEESVRRELLFYERDGADATTRWLIEAIQGQLESGIVHLQYERQRQNM